MTDRLTQNYAITFSGGSYTITYTSFPSETMVAVQTEFVLHVLGNYFYMRTGNSNTLLDFTKCTSPTGVSRAALISAIQALYNPTVFTPTLTISPSSATDQLAVVNNSKVVFCNFPEPSLALCRLTFPTASDTIVGRATTDTLTNKTITSPLCTNVTLDRVAIFSVATNRFALNLLTSDGHLYCDHGNAAQNVIFRSNNGATTQMTISDSQTLVPRLQVSAAAATNALVLGTTNQLQIQYATLGASRVVTIPDPGAAAFFVMTAANQTLGGVKTFSSGVPITATTNQLVLGTTNTTTITSPAPVASRVYTIPDAGAAASFVMTASNQTIGGTKTFSSGVLLPTTGGTATALDHYEETTHVSTFTGGTFTSGSITLAIIRIGRKVTIRWPAIQGAATAAIVNNTALPTRFFPTAIQAFIIPGQTATVQGTLQASVGTTGFLTFARTDGTGFATGTNGPSVGSISYTLA